MCKVTGRGDQEEANEIIVVYAKNKLIVNFVICFLILGFIFEKPLLHCIENQVYFDFLVSVELSVSPNWTCN